MVESSFREQMLRHSRFFELPHVLIADCRAPEVLHYQLRSLIEDLGYQRVESSGPSVWPSDLLCEEDGAGIAQDRVLSSLGYLPVRGSIVGHNIQTPFPLWQKVLCILLAPVFGVGILLWLLVARGAREMSSKVCIFYTGSVERTSPNAAESEPGAAAAGSFTAEMKVAVSCDLRATNLKSATFRDFEWLKERIVAVLQTRPEQLKGRGLDEAAKAQPPAISSRADTLEARFPVLTTDGASVLHADDYEHYAAVLEPASEEVRGAPPAETAPGDEPSERTVATEPQDEERQERRRRRRKKKAAKKKKEAAAAPQGEEAVIRCKRCGSVLPVGSEEEMKEQHYRVWCAVCHKRYHIRLHETGQKPRSEEEAHG